MVSFFQIFPNQKIDDDLISPVKNRIDKKGLMQHYYRIREYSHTFKSKEEEKKDEEGLNLSRNPLAGKKVKFYFYFLYNGNDPITEKDRHRISIASYLAPDLPVCFIWF